MSKQYTEAEIAAFRNTVRKLRWSGHFHRTLESPDGGKVDMYMLIDDDTGAQTVALSVPHGPDGRMMAEYVCAACSNPWFLRRKTVLDGSEMAIAFNRALEPFLIDGEIDAREVGIAAMVMIESHLADVPRAERAKLVDSFMAKLSELRSVP